VTAFPCPAAKVRGRRVIMRPGRGEPWIGVVTPRPLDGQGTGSVPSGRRGRGAWFWLRDVPGRLGNALRVEQYLNRGSCGVGVQGRAHDSLHDDSVEDDDQLICQALRILGAAAPSLAGKVIA